MIKANLENTAIGDSIIYHLKSENFTFSKLEVSNTKIGYEGWLAYFSMDTSQMVSLKMNANFNKKQMCALIKAMNVPRLL